MKTKELVVISGKGGTGKTSIAASLALLAVRPVIADCDVDAANLHLILTPEVRERHRFISGQLARIRQSDCLRCGMCVSCCRFDAFGSVAPLKDDIGGPSYVIDPAACEGCGLCARICPGNAIDMEDRDCGEWMISDTRAGVMVHASLGIGADNSGKLVSVVRDNSRRIATTENNALIIVDGPPGIGCPVIASLTGATHALVVTEPTVSGEHDLERILALTSHFAIPSSVCINKWDINPDVSGRIEAAARRAGAGVAPGIRYDKSFTHAQVAALGVVETDSAAAEDIKALWAWLADRL